MADEFRRERLRALAAPLLTAIRMSQEIKKIPRSLVQASLGQEAGQDSATSLHLDDGILTPRSHAQDWHSKVVEVGSIFGISELRTPDEILKDMAARMGITDASLGKEDTLASIAERLGLGKSRDKPYISLLESIGANLGVQTEPFWDQNLYYMKAEKYWTESIARKLGIPTDKSSEEILLGVGQKIGIEFGPKDREDVAILSKISLRLGIAPDEDSVTMLRRVEATVRAGPFSR